VSGRLTGRRALLTGAAGGIGVAIGSAFVREGATLAAVGRNEAALEELAATLEGRAYAVPADVGDPVQAGEAVRRGWCSPSTAASSPAASEARFQPLGIGSR